MITQPAAQGASKVKYCDPSLHILPSFLTQGQEGGEGGQEGTLANFNQKQGARQPREGSRVGGRRGLVACCTHNLLSTQDWTAASQDSYLHPQPCLHSTPSAHKIPPMPPPLYTRSQGSPNLPHCPPSDIILPRNLRAQHMRGLGQDLPRLVPI